MLLLADAGDVATDSGAADGVAWGKLLLGLFLIHLGLRQWRNRPKAGEQAAMPKWMEAIDGFTPVKALGTGVLLSAINPKNLILAAGAGAAIAQAGLSGNEDAVVVILFVIVASVSIAVPVLVYLFGGEKAQHVLDGWKAWLGEHNAAVMTVAARRAGFGAARKGARRLRLRPAASHVGAVQPVATPDRGFPGADTELAVDAADVRFQRVPRHVQRVGDLLHRERRRQEPPHLLLPTGKLTEVLQRRAPIGLGDDRGRDLRGEAAGPCRRRAGGRTPRTTAPRRRRCARIPRTRRG